jgi:hypothetical protein
MDIVSTRLPRLQSEEWLIRQALKRAPPPQLVA